MSEKSQPSVSRSKYVHGLLYQRMSDDLHRAGMSRRTHDGYLRAVRQLADYSRRSPDRITEDQLRRFFLQLCNEKKFATGSLRVVRWLVCLWKGWTWWLGSGVRFRNYSCSRLLSATRLSPRRILEAVLVLAIPIGLVPLVLCRTKPRPASCPVLRE